MAESRDGFEDKTFIKPYDDLEASKPPLRGPEAYPLLEIVQGPKQGAWFTIAYQKEITLGRAATNSIILEDNSVSRSHSVLQAAGEGFTIRDIGSRNGTFVNEKKIQGEVTLSHRDTIKIGIYTLRYLAEPLEEMVPAREEATPRVEETEGTPTEMVMPPVEEAPAAEAPTGERTINEDIQEIMAEEEKAPPEAPEEMPPPEVPPAPAMFPPTKGKGRSLKALGILLGILIVLGGGSYAAYRFGAFDSLFAPKEAEAPSGEKAAAEQKAEGKVLTPPPAAEGETLPVFLEVDSEPVMGKVFYRGKELGTTPFKINLQVPAGKPQELGAEFYLEKLGEKVAAKETFEVKSQDEVVKVHFKPQLGALHIKALPKDGQLYLEGKFEGEQGPAKAIQVKDITFDEPLYLPFGSYVAEIKVPEPLPGSETTHPVARYRREFAFNDQTAEFTIDAPDEVLKKFPAKIGTEPAGAEILVDGQKVGDTPFEGDLPMGRHQLTLKKEGFNDLEKEIAIEVNTPYVASFNLETSPAGEFVNKGRDFLQKGMYNEAIEQLAEAIKRNPDPTELNQIHMLLGEAFLGYKTYDQAFAYFQRASEAPEYAPRAKLGMAEAQAGMGQKDQALINILDVILNTKDAKIQSQAQSVYKRISPMKSILYVNSDPKGAQITVNGNPISQATPVILSDLMVGSYRIGVNKPGFKSYETRVTVPVSSIKPLIVKLEPEQ